MFTQLRKPSSTYRLNPAYYTYNLQSGPALAAVAEPWNASGGPRGGSTGTTMHKRCRCVYLEQGLLSCWSSPSPASSKVSWELETKRFPISLKRRGNTWIHAKTKNKSKKLKNQSEAARTPPVVFPPPDCCTFSSSPLFPNIPALLLLPSCPCFMPKQTREKLQLTP